MMVELIAMIPLIGREMVVSVKDRGHIKGKFLKYVCDKAPHILLDNSECDKVELIRIKDIEHFAVAS